MDLNCDITEAELQYALSQLKNTSPGLDRFHNTFLKNLPSSELEFLLKMFNTSWFSGYVPED